MAMFFVLMRSMYKSFLKTNTLPMTMSLEQRHSKVIYSLHLDRSQCISLLKVHKNIFIFYQRAHGDTRIQCDNSCLCNNLILNLTSKKKIVLSLPCLLSIFLGPNIIWKDIHYGYSTTRSTDKS